MHVGTNRLTRSHLRTQGIALGKAATVGSIVAIELLYEAEPFMLGRVKATWFMAASEEQSQWMGTIKKKVNDEILVVERLRPWSPGSSIFEETGEDVIVFIDDIRMGDVPVKHIQSRSRTSVSAARLELPPGVKVQILQLISSDSQPRISTGHPDFSTATEN